MAKGRALHPRLVAAWDAFAGADKALRGGVEAINDRRAVERLAAIEASEGRKARYHIEAMMIHAKRVVRAQDSAKPDLAAITQALNDYEASVKALAAQAGGAPLFVVPLGVKAWLADVGIRNAVELDWWQSARVGAVEIVLTPVQHWSGRSLTDRMETLWGGYAIFAPDFQVFFAGDTAYSKDFADIHARFVARHGAGRGFDLALIPVGAYDPRWFMSAQHVDPTEAVRIHQDLAAERSIGIHWGTFQLTDEPLDEPPQALARAAREAGLSDDAFSVMAVGATRRFAPRAP